MLKKLLLLTGGIFCVCLIVSQAVLINIILDIINDSKENTAQRANSAHFNYAEDEARIDLNIEIAVSKPETALVIGIAVMKKEFDFINDDFDFTVTDKDSFWSVNVLAPLIEIEDGSKIRMCGNAWIEIRKSDGKIMAVRVS